MNFFLKEKTCYSFKNNAGMKWTSTTDWIPTAFSIAQESQSRMRFLSKWILIIIRFPSRLFPIRTCGSLLIKNIWKILWLVNIGDWLGPTGRGVSGGRCQGSSRCWCIFRGGAMKRWKWAPVKQQDINTWHIIKIEGIREDLNSGVENRYGHCLMDFWTRVPVHFDWTIDCHLVSFDRRE